MKSVDLRAIVVFEGPEKTQTHTMDSSPTLKSA